MVGIGAAVQVGILTGEIEDVVLVDVTPLSLGIETEGGLFARIVERNATIPTSAGQIFTNAEDNQVEMDFHVLQGEREMAEDNISLGQFKLTGLPPLPRGKGKVEVNFRIDVNGIVTVYARDLYTEQETGIEIDASHLLSDEEVALALQEAENAAREDMIRREETEINLICADSMIRAAELVLEKEPGKKDQGPLSEQIEDAIFQSSGCDLSRVIRTVITELDRPVAGTAERRPNETGQTKHAAPAAIKTRVSPGERTSSFQIRVDFGRPIGPVGGRLSVS